MQQIALILITVLCLAVNSCVDPPTERAHIGSEEDRLLIQCWESEPTKDSNGTPILVKAFVYSDNTITEQIGFYPDGNYEQDPSRIITREGSYEEAFENELIGTLRDGSRMIIQGVKGVKLDGGERSIFESPMKGNYYAVWPQTLGRAFYLMPKPIQTPNNTR